jgi:hypothetical protein
VVDNLMKPRNPMIAEMMFRERGKHGRNVQSKQRRAQQKDLQRKFRETEAL